ncbi:hypothetical protein WJX75_007627 [Coccomyxa subellipsoidea]|uniref:Galactose oxidase n=1 Tax=Coccomyxa subellipsoidea TaxID=248742 RepID=A0ABR2YCG6_9CHLO
MHRDRKIAYTTGVVFGRCFFCLTLADDPHMACCLLRTVGSGVLGGTRKIPLEFANCCRLRQPYASRAKQCLDVAPQLVACSNAMYLCGGVNVLENGQSVPSNALYIFEPKREKREHPPSPRWGHATFVHGNRIYIFGGTDGTTDSFGKACSMT